MPKSSSPFPPGPGCLGAPFKKYFRAVTPALLACSLLSGCFAGEPDDSPYTIPRGEAFESLQLEIEADGTFLIAAKVGMYMAHNDPDPSYPEEFQVAVQNRRSILLRRSEGGWSATAFKNIQSNEGNSFPTLIPDSEGRYQAFLSDGGEIKRYVFGDGVWNRAAGTEWSEWVLYGSGRYGSGNWNRHPSIAMAGADLLLTLQTDGQGRSRVMEGKDRKVEISDSSGFSPLAFHAGAGFRVLAASGYSQAIGSGQGGFTYALEVKYYRWREGDTRVEKRSLGTFGSLGETFFAPYHGTTALFISGPDRVIAFPLDDSGRVAGRDTLALPVAPKPIGRDSLPSPQLTRTSNPMVAVDTSGCLHTLGILPDSGRPSIRYAHWNGCSPDNPDTLAIPKPDTSKFYLGLQANLRMASDGTPVAAVLVRETRQLSGTMVQTSWSDPTFLFLAEFRGGGWRLEKVDERRPGTAR